EFRADDTRSAAGGWLLEERGPGWSFEEMDLDEPLLPDWSGVGRIVLLLFHGDPSAETVRPTICIDADCSEPSPSPEVPSEPSGGCVSVFGPWWVLVRRRRL
ncbi:MAG: hypothetical protein AAFY60_08630, partial [Myxococcota bacterium]